MKMYFFVRLTTPDSALEVGAPVSIAIRDRLLEIGTVRKVKNKKDGQYLIVEAYKPTTADITILTRLNFDKKGIRVLKPGEYNIFN